jgi:hypothetical protein
VIDLWIKLQGQSAVLGGRVVHVLGNHEAELLANPLNDSKASELLAELQGRNIPLTDLIQDHY